jgi:hypothetical protein
VKVDLIGWLEFDPNFNACDGGDRGVTIEHNNNKMFSTSEASTHFFFLDFLSVIPGLSHFHRWRVEGAG